MTTFDEDVKDVVSFSVLLLGALAKGVVFLFMTRLYSPASRLWDSDHLVATVVGCRAGSLKALVTGYDEDLKGAVSLKFEVSVA